jgi:type I restriction enzyme, R subunit
MGDGGSEYLTPEARARVEIDQMLGSAGWVVQDAARVNLSEGPGVAVREFILDKPHGRADYLLFVNREPVGAIEAKPAGTTLTEVEWQSTKYSTGVPDDLNPPIRPLPFIYESTGKPETRFTCTADPDPRSRRVFWFHRPETLASWIREWKGNSPPPTLRLGLRSLPPLDTSRLWDAQIRAITNLEQSLGEDRPRSLIQMATGSGKTFTAANISYRLVKYAGARRVLFLVDRANLGRQTLREFQQFETPDDGRKFTELYNVQHLGSNLIDSVSRVCISTIQRLYSILRGEPEMPEEWDESSPYEFEPSDPVPVEYNPNVPIETFDFVVVDECHRSIYGVWRQVLEYFDAHIIGLTATPSKQTFGFFNQNLVMEYPHEQAVSDGVNVDFNVYRIRTEISEKGSSIDAGIVSGFRDRDTRQVRWEKLDEPLDYQATELDRKVVARDQIRTVIRTFKDRLFTEIFPGRKDVPKTLIFAKDDSHSDDIVQIVREEFGKGNDFAAKITYRSAGKAEDLIASFRNSYNPRIAVTVDMIATGTDVKPLECLVFMRSVRSRTFFEQMRGRAVRVINEADFRAVTPDAKAKTRFVLVDAIGVTETPLVDMQPLDRKPTVSFDKLLKQVSYGNHDPDLVASLASRIARLDRQITMADREELEGLGGVALRTLTHNIVKALDPDEQYETALRETDRDEPTPDEIAAVATRLIREAVEPLASNPDLRERMLEVRRSYEQALDETSKDEVIEAGFSEDATDQARATVESFKRFIEEHKDEITALEVLYSRPYSQRLTFKHIRELANAIERPPHALSLERVWRAYQALERSKVRGSGGAALTDIVSLVRFTLEQEDELVPFQDVVNQRFENWMQEQESAGQGFSDEQRRWLEAIRDVVGTSLWVSKEDFDYAPFAERGGLGRAYAVFGKDLERVLDELNGTLAA